MTTPPEDEHDEDHTPAVPEPPRRVPFGVAVATGFLGLLTVLLLIGATATLTTSGLYRDTVGEATAEALGTVLIAVSAVLVAASAWAFVRNGNTIASMVVGGLTMLAGLICLIQGVMSETDAEGVRVGVVALAIGLGITLPPLVGHGPLYLAARRVWAKAEREWLQDMATSDTPPAAPQQPWGQPWTPYPATPQQAWPHQQQAWPGPGPHQGQPSPYQGQPGPYQGQPGPYQGQPGPHQGQPAPQYPQQQQPQPQAQAQAQDGAYQHQGQGWTSPHPFDYQGMPQPAPGPIWPAATAPASAPPVSSAAPATPASAPPVPPAEAPQVPHSGPPQAAAQQAPTEHIRTNNAPPPLPTSSATPTEAPQTAPPAG